LISFYVFEVTVFGGVVVDQVTPSGEPSVSIHRETVLVEQEWIHLFVRRVSEIFVEFRLAAELD
jgi:hypothetical protein